MRRESKIKLTKGPKTFFGGARALGGFSLQEEVQSHRSKGLGDAVAWRTRAG